MKKRQGRVNKENFALTKKLLDSGALSTRDISRVVGLSATTVGYIKRSETLEDYKDIIEAVVDRQKEVLLEKQGQNTQPEESPEPEEQEQEEPRDTESPFDLEKLLSNISDNFETITKQLENISISVKWIENHTEVKPRSRLFG